MHNYKYTYTYIYNYGQIISSREPEMLGHFVRLIYTLLDLFASHHSVMTSPNFYSRPLQQTRTASGSWSNKLIRGGQMNTQTLRDLKRP